MDFQIQTLLSICALAGAMLAGLQMLAGWRLQAPCLFGWSLANIFLTAACVFLAMRQELGLAPSVLLGNGSVLIGVGLIFSGIRIFDERPPALEMVALVTLVGVGALALSLAAGDRAADRITVISLLVAGWSVTAGRALLETPGAGPIISRLASALVLLCVAAGYMVRGIGAQFGLFLSTGHDGRLIEVVVVVVGFVLAISWTFGSLFMVLEKLASLDDLTGLYNRRATLRRGAELVRAARARGQPLSLLLADLDHFKSVNDRFGHDVGDRVLKYFAMRMPRVLRLQDLVGRHGGEEFCILLPGADATKALASAEHLRALAEAHLARVDGHDTHVTLTVGAATYVPGQPGCDSLACLIHAADAALYSGKALGRNRVVLAEPGLRHAALCRHDLEAAP